MKEHELQSIANQLACPDGEMGLDTGIKMNELNKFIYSQTTRMLSPQMSESIVEIGPGNGLLSLPILDALGKDGYYLGVELSDVMADEANLALSGKDCSAEIFNGDYSDLNIPLSSVDGVIAVNVLYFIEDLATFFKQIFLWIKPGGRVAFGIRSEVTLRNLPFTQYGFNIRTTSEIKSVMAESGFSSVTSFDHDEGVTSFQDIDIPEATVVIIGKKVEE